MDARAFSRLKKFDRVRIEDDPRVWVVGIAYSDGRRLVYPVGAGDQANAHQRTLTPAEANTLTLVSAG